AGRGHEVVVAFRLLRQQRSHVLRQKMVIGIGICLQDLRDTRNLGGGFGSAIHPLADDQDVEVAAGMAGDFLGGSNGAQGGGLEGAAFVLGNDQDAHCQMTFASFFSFSTSSVTDPTLTPAWRAGGSLTLTTLRRGLGSTPRSAADITSIGFFFAFMMFGREA